MAKLKYTDLVEAGAIDKLIDDLKELKQQAEDNPLGDGKDIEEFNKQLVETVEITDKLIEKQKVENKTLKDQQAALSATSVESDDLQQSQKDLGAESKKTGTAIEGQGKSTKRATTETRAFTRVARSATRGLRGLRNAAINAGRAIRNISKRSILIALAAVVAAFRNVQDVLDIVNTGMNYLAIQGQNIAKLFKGQIDLAKAFNPASIWETAKAMTVVNKEAKLLEALTNKAIAVMDNQIERNKIVRDDETKSFARRTAANEIIIKALDKEEKIVKRNFAERRKAVDLQLAQDENNIEFKIAEANLDKEEFERLKQINTQRQEAHRATIQLTREEQALFTEYQRLINAGYNERELASISEIADLGKRKRLLTEFYTKVRNEDTDLLEKRLENIDEYSAAWFQTMMDLESVWQSYATSMDDLNQAHVSATLEGYGMIVEGLGQVGSALSASARQQQIIAASVGAINAALAVTQVFADPKTTNIYEKIVAVLAAIAMGIGLVATIKNVDVPSYSTGTEDLRGGNNGILVRAHRGERITPTHINNQLMGVSNDALPGLVHMGMMYQEGMMVLAQQHLQETRNTNNLLGKWEYPDGSGAQTNLAGTKKTHYVN